MQIQFDVENSRALDIKLYLHIVLVYLLSCVQPDDGHHDDRNM